MISPGVARFLAGATQQTPFLVIDLDVVEQRYREIRAAMPYAKPYFAVKATPEPAVIRRLVELGACFDVASPGEIDLCLEQGAAPECLSYGNTIKKEADIEYAYKLGVPMFAFDSLREVEKLAQAAPGASVFCRLLAGSADARWPLSDKFGCSTDFAVDLLQKAAKWDLRPYGVSFHVGSQQTNPDRWDASIAAAAKVFGELREIGVELEMVNIGGGYPARYVDDVPPIAEYGDKISAALDRWFGADRPVIVSEPGRSLTADAGVLRAQVVSVRRPFEGGDRWIYVDAGKFGGLAETEGESIIYRVLTSQTGPTKPVVLAGPTCDSLDILYRRTKHELPLALDVGDTVDFLSAGAYTTSYSSVGFNGFPPLPTYCIGDKR
ncbi:type III PLP-dependent enzyme [Kibdelosporangium persicum]|uniref:Type III PLP-dependent enzyme n=1 Tax=Kibdelosporangium persicum TaxID=2698649 RepID=A0ABX2EVU5_9PSEU|nr:type III PLP-dependent enzyme [Kibdelosporangium persicum]NRN62850.1 Type III PLP-dependent enzyme [Kibdelosporangium persicum]